MKSGFDGYVTQDNKRKHERMVHTWHCIALMQECLMAFECIGRSKGGEGKAAHMLIILTCC